MRLRWDKKYCNFALLILLTFFHQSQLLDSKLTSHPLLAIAHCLLEIGHSLLEIGHPFLEIGHSLLVIVIPARF